MNKKPNNPELFAAQGEVPDRELTKAEETKIAEVGDEMKEVVVNESGDPMKIRVQKFHNVLNRRPLMHLVRHHQNYDYLPIRYYERLAQQIFLGQIKYEVIHYGNIFNEVTVHVRCHYRHPVTGEWLFVDGLGSSQIMQDANTKVVDFASFKKPNALQTCLPKAYAEAIKNGWKKVGTIFGSDLNRQNIEGDYDAVTHTLKPLNQ